MTTTGMRLQLTEGVSVVSLPQVPTDGLLIAKLLTRLGDAGVNLDMISQAIPSSEQVSLSFTILDSELVATLKVLNSSEFEGKFRPLISSKNVKIQLYDPEMDVKCGVAAAVFSAIVAKGIEIRMVTTSDLDISLAIPGVCQMDAVDAIRKVLGIQ